MHLQRMNGDETDQRRQWQRVIAVAILAFYIVIGPLPVTGGQTFEDVTNSVGLNIYTPNAADSSVAWGDYNQDGWVDVFLGSYDETGGGIFENSGGTSFSQISDIGVASFPGLFVDYNNDNLPDIATMMAGGHISRNNGGGVFTWVPGGAVMDPNYTWQSEHAVWADFDNDGFLDYYRTGWQTGGTGNQGPYYPDGVFISNQAAYFGLSWLESGDPYADFKAGRSATSADFDEDGDMDVYVSNYSLGANRLWVNAGDGAFSDQAAARGVAGEGDTCGTGSSGQQYFGGQTIGSAWGDLDNDGHLDLVVINLNHSPETVCVDMPQFYRNMGASGGWNFESKTAAVAMEHSSSHASPALADYDNDGDLDIFVSVLFNTVYEPAGETCTLLRNDGDWNFTDVSALHGLDISPDNANFQAAWADYDNDGDLDLFTDRKLFRNTLSNGNHWLMVALRGNVAAGVSLDAVGAQVRIDLGGGNVLARQVENATGWGNQNDPRLHFGLGSVVGPVDLEVTWPNGTVEVVEGVAVDQVVSIQLAGPNVGARDDLVVVSPAWGVANWYGAHTEADPIYIDDSDGPGEPNVVPITTSITGFGFPTGTPLLGDVNGDGFEDAVVVQSDAVPGGYSWYAGHTADMDLDGIGELSTAAQSSLPLFGLVPGYVFLADVTGDGVDDAIVINEGFYWHCQPSTPGIGLDPTTPLQGPVQWGLPGDTPHVGDFNGDGYADICVYRPTTGEWIINFSDEFGIGSGVIEVGQFGGNHIYEVSLVGDVDGDGRDDALVVDINDGSGGLLWLASYARSSGQIQWEPGWHSSYVHFGLAGDTPFVADLSGDGQLDIGVTRTHTSDGHTMWFAAFSDFFGDLPSSGVPDTAGDFGNILFDKLLTGQLDADNDRADLVVYERSSVDSSWRGSHTQPDPVYMDGVLDVGPYSFGAYTEYAPLMGDVNADGVDDMVMRYPNGQTPERLRWIAGHSAVDSDGLGEFDATNQSFLAQHGGNTDYIIYQTLGDVNGDGADDAISLNASYNWNAAHSIPGIGLDAFKSSTSTVQWGLPDLDDVPITGDVNGDGFLDVGVFRPASGNWMFALSGPSGLGQLGSSPVGQFGGANWEYVFTGDLNGDGRDDGILVDADDGSGLLYWVGAFADSSGMIDFTNGPQVFVHFGLDTTTPFVADINGDGLTDIGVLTDSGVVGANQWQWIAGFTTAGGIFNSTLFSDDEVLFGFAPSYSSVLTDTPLIANLGDYDPLPGDINDDGVVDGTDAELFMLVLSGPDVTTPPIGYEDEFNRADIDNDGDVDVKDLALFQNV